MTISINTNSAPNPAAVAAARAGIELALLDQAAKAEGRLVQDDDLASLADRFGEAAVAAAMHASVDMLKELVAGREAQMACLRAMRSAGQETRQ